ncbi:MAG: hypothetical protein H6502_03850 [Candidatus Woesearchaeota archaeon]|nr:MAG: hypothetical protein H6502_03850 [Candidatus Woesearchaeota archaeon]
MLARVCFGVLILFLLPTVIGLAGPPPETMPEELPVLNPVYAFQENYDCYFDFNTVPGSVEAGVIYANYSDFDVDLGITGDVDNAHFEQGLKTLFCPDWASSPGHTLGHPQTVDTIIGYELDGHFNITDSQGIMNPIELPLYERSGFDTVEYKNAWTEDCSKGYACLFYASDVGNAHVASCDGDNPYNFSVLVCARTAPLENCYNSIDDNYDGFIDCVDSDCHAAAIEQAVDAFYCDNSALPAGSMLTTDFCVNNPTLCNNTEEAIEGTDPVEYGVSYYCSYVEEDDPVLSNREAYCCPQGYYPQRVSPWEYKCLETATCYDESQPEFCNSMFHLFAEFPAWSTENNPLDLDCNQYNEPTGSEACCLVSRWGGVDYFDTANVRVY